MKIENQSVKTKTQRAAVKPNLRLVKDSPTGTSRPAQTSRPKAPTSDRFSKSGEKDEKTSARVQSIFSGLEESRRSASSSGSGSGEGLIDDIKGGIENAKDRAKEFFEDLFSGHRRRDDRLAEGREENPTVAVIDIFDTDNSKDEPTHGEQVEAILMENSGLSEEDIQRYRAGGGGNIDELVKASPEEFGEVFDTYIEDRTTGLLDGSSDAIEDILSDKNTNIRTINQSLGAPESRIANDIAQKMDKDPAFRERFLEYSGLDADASEKEVLQALVDEVSDSRRSNETVQESKDRYDQLVKEAYDRGITTIDSSGNYGSFARRLEKLGVETDADFHTDVLNTPLVLSVGATNTKGTADLGDDTEARFSSPNAGADIAANGTQVSSTIDGKKSAGDGTSFSAPQVAAAAAVLAREYPELTPAQIREILINTAVNPAGLDSDIVGAGVVQQQAALDLAEQIAA